MIIASIFIEVDLLYIKVSVYSGAPATRNHHRGRLIFCKVFFFSSVHFAVSRIYVCKGTWALIFIWLLTKSPLVLLRGW